MTDWVVVTDFDGTLTTQDIGNEICKIFAEEKFLKLQKAYRAGELSLLEYQDQMWGEFPAPMDKFLEAVDHVAALRPGVPEFIEKCRNKNIDIHIASCGLRPYIERVLNRLLPKHVSYFQDKIHCNEVHLINNQIQKIKPTRISKDGRYPVDKGEISQSFRPLKILGIGNGSSDRTFLGNVDILAATEGLQSYCESRQYPHRSFFDFHDLMDLEIF